MSVHLLKLCVGADAIEDLVAWQKGRLAARVRAGGPAEIWHQTFQTPKRREDLLQGGSLYWVIRGVIQCRQRILDLREGTKDDGTACCLLVLDPAVIPVRPMPRRPFQGWRYLDPADAPADLAGAGAGDVAAMPAQMRKELAALGLL